IRTDDGEFLVSWFAGTHEKHDDVGIWISKGVPGHWSVPTEIAKVRNDAHWNPVLFKSPDGKIILYFKVGKVIDEWETWYMVFDDHGSTWTRAREQIGRASCRERVWITGVGGAVREAK